MRTAPIDIQPSVEVSIGASCAGGPPVQTTEGPSVFVTNTPTENAKARSRRHYLANTQLYKARANAWKAANRNKVRELARATRAHRGEEMRAAEAQFRAGNKETLNERSRLWRIKNPDRAREICKEWRARNPEALTLKSLRRRACLCGASGYHYTSAQHIKWRWEMWGGRCWMCGGRATETDHVVALSRGGSHWPANLRPICRVCNASKGAKALVDLKLDRAGII